MSATIAPWTVLRSEMSFADRWLRVRSDDCRTPQGQLVGPYHVIEYPDWVTVVPVTREGRLLLVREYRHGVGAVLLGLPGGLVDARDAVPGAPAAEAAARRELLEETGHGGGALRLLIATLPNPSNQTNTAYCYLATDLRPVAPIHPDGGGEAVELVEGDLVHVLGQLRSGELSMHAVHVAALWSAAMWLMSAPSAPPGSLPARLRSFVAGQ